MKKITSKPVRFRADWLAPLLLMGVIALLFWRSFAVGIVHFSNDGPLGQQNVNWLKLPAAMTGMWDDLNDIGSSVGVYAPSISAVLSWLLGPVGFAKFYAPIALFILGLGAWTFFRQLKLSPLAATLGALAAALNGTFLAAACWGVASQQIAIGMDFFALALVMSNDTQTQALLRWTRLALAGLAVGVNVMEAADIGAIFSIFIAAYVFLNALADEGGSVPAKCVRGVGRVGVIAVFAGFIAAQTITALVGSQIQGIAGAGQDTETKAKQWDFATQWSVPKKETLGLFVPGLFGYKMDTPNNMMPAVQDAYKGGVYWGGIGRDPANDRFFDNGGQGSPPDPNWMRQTGGGNYCGILVVLVAFWAIAQSLRRRDSLFAESQRRCIWFWMAVIFLCLLFSWGRFAPFYALLYKLPYFSTIRNPIKFLIVFSWAVVILFGYGVHALSRRYLEVPAGKSSSFSNWWAKAGGFDRKWTFACAAAIGVSLFGWLIYASEKSSLVRYLQTVGFDENAQDINFRPSTIAAFSVGQVGWFVLLFALTSGLLILVIAGFFSGKRAKLGGFLLGLLLVIDMVRADLPYICHWDYIQKYEIGSLNPIETFLKDKPYEHRVAILPFEPQQQLRPYDNAFFGNGIYRIEWTQHHFLYYNIQSLDLIQMPRMAADLKGYLETLSPHTEAEAPLFARQWELTNTRYLLGAAGFLDVINQQLDPAQHRFRIAQRFDLVAKPGITQPTGLEELTATVSPDGDLALFEFTGALPRAKLYSNWQTNNFAALNGFTTNGLNDDELKTLANVGTNDFLTLKKLALPSFDPQQTVLLSAPLPTAPSTNENSSTVEFKSYAPKDIVFDAKAAAPSVLLLNDKYDSNWRVTVDGKPAELLRCNFIMRGVYLAPGEHTVEFQFSLPNKPLYVTLTAIITGICLLGLLIFLQRRERATET